MARFDGMQEDGAATLALGYGGPAAPALDRTAEIADLWRILIRRKLWILGAAALFTLAAIAFGVLTPSLYTASSQILVDPRDKQVVSNDLNPAAVAPDGGVTQVESQVRVVESASVLGRAVASQRLAEDPEFAGEGALGKLLKSLGLGSAREVDPADLALRNLRKRLSIKRADKVFVIDITVTTKSPAKSAALANAIAEAYLADQADARTEAARRASSALAARLDEQRERVREAENRVEAYKAANNLVSSSNGTLVSEQQLSDLNAQITASRTKTAELRARIDQIEQLRKSGISEDSTAEALGSPVVAKLRQQFAELSQRQADLTTQYGARHPAIVSGQAQLQQVRQLIVNELTRIAKSARADYDRAAANDKALQDQLDRLKGQKIETSQASVRLRELERDLEASRAVYTSFLVRTRELREQTGIDSANARIISFATPPQDKSWPLPALFAFAGLVAGLSLGAGAALTREYLKPAILSRSHLLRIGGAPVIGTLFIGAGTKRASEAAQATSPAMLLGRLLGMIRGGERDVDSILITSGSRDGLARMRTAQAMAAAAQARGLRVLLVHPDGSSTPGAGLLDVLRGDLSIGKLLPPETLGDLQLLGIGRGRRLEFDGRAALRSRFRDELSSNFDLVIVDGGSLPADQRAAPLVPLCDIVLLVASEGETLQADLTEAREAAELAGQGPTASLLVVKGARG